MSQTSKGRSAMTHREVLRQGTVIAAGAAAGPVDARRLQGRCRPERVVHVEDPARRECSMCFQLTPFRS